MKQTQALTLMMDGESVFLTGAPGAGKTYVLNEFIRRAQRKGRKIAVTASTGIAATHIGGTTIHSWSGLGIRDSLTQQDVAWLAKNDKLAKRYNAVECLVIDEISMLHGKRLDMVNQACQLLRHNDEPFGGLQVILVGDLFQLPPVSRASELVDFAHESDAWQQLNPKICYLTEQHRQQDDGLLSVLEAMRDGALETMHTEMLQSRLGKRPEADLLVTRLYSHNIDVETINTRHLQNIYGKGTVYSMTSSGAAAKAEQLKKGLLAPENLELKRGAEVMFVANDFGKGFVNGSRGQVVEFRAGWPVVALVSSGKEITVEPHEWNLTEDGRVRATVRQLPLRLAWAITIHKSQGMSLDAAEIDLSKSFTPGMGYVALSRVRSLDGVYLNGLNATALQLHPDIYELDRQLRSASAQLADITEEIGDEPEPAVQDPNAAADLNLLAKLKAWRRMRSETDRVPPYVIAHDSFLLEIATQKPGNEQQLLGTKGFGPKKLEKYGEDILEIMKAAGYDKPVEASPAAPQPLSPEEAQARANLRAAIHAEYPRSSKRWTPDEDDRLLSLFHEQTPLSKVCAELERSPGGIWARLITVLGTDNGQPEG